MIKKLNSLNVIILLILILSFNILLDGETEDFAFSYKKMEKKILEMKDEGNIPGMSIILIRKDNPVLIKNYGYADLKQKIPVTAYTRFELASCSKAFTALAALQLEDEGLLNLDLSVSEYLPWFYVKFNNQRTDVTIRQLLHHTSGIPFKTISKIKEGNDKKALEQTVRNIVGIQLNSPPGKQFRYTSINYDVVGAIIEKVSKMSFEEYMSQKIFKPLQLGNTTVGQENQDPLMASGYKIGFFSPRKYDSPIYRGNNPSAYIISNAKDIARWLKLQLGMIETSKKKLIKKSQQPNRTIPPSPKDFSSYAMGWRVFQKGVGEFVHTGLNPNFTSFIGFRPGEEVGVAVLANVNSNYTSLIGRFILRTLMAEKDTVTSSISSSFDKSFSIASILIGVYILSMIFLLIVIIKGLVGKKRKYRKLNCHGIKMVIIAISVIVLLGIGIYLAPKALAGFSWSTIIPWAPISMPVTAILLLAAAVISFVIFFISLIFPHNDGFINSLPFVIILSSCAGFSNSAAILIVIQSFSKTIAVKYLVFYFMLVVFLHFLTSKIVRRRLLVLTNNLVYHLRLKLIKKMFAVNYQTFEKLDIGRIYATVNDDTTNLGNFPTAIVNLITNLSVVIFIFMYLLTISFIPTVLTLAIIGIISVSYVIISRKVNVLLGDARDTQNVFMKLIDGLIKGFKELSLHFKKKNAYAKDLENTCEIYRQKRILAFFKLMDLNVFFRTVLLLILGTVSIGFPIIFPSIELYTLVSFVMILFYVVGPIATIISVFPNLLQIRVSWNRIQQLLNDLPGDWEPNKIKKLLPKNYFVEKIKIQGLTYEYEQKEEHERFAVGPVDFQAKKGEIIFITGGNGSGKTTLAKLLTGLYKPAKGEIIIETNGEKSRQLGEYFSTVFSDYHLFEKLYNIDLSKKEKQIEKYLQLLELEKKVQLKNNSFSTIDLSAGQRKRLALLQCYLEDSPIYLFDEWAADQDPTFRKYFYRELLIEMKKAGKIVIAITHDDRYFDIADRIIRMDMGKTKIQDAKTMLYLHQN